MHAGLVIAKLVTLLLGLAIAFQAFRGYRHHDSEPMLYVAIGFAFISVGAIIQGFLFEWGGLDLHDAATVQTAIVAVGMLFVLYSLHGPMKSRRGE